MTQELKTVARYSDRMSADFAAGLLNANGIPAEVFGQASAYPSINAAINSLEVKVNADNYDDAVKLLAAKSEAE